MKDFVQNINQLKFGDIVYHSQVYKGNEPLKVVGLRMNEVECKGDYSGVGLDNSSCWLSLNGLLTIKTTVND